MNARRPTRASTSARRRSTRSRSVSFSCYHSPSRSPVSSYGGGVAEPREHAFDRRMIRSWISLGVLFVVVAVLAGWVAYRPKTADSEAHAISTLTTSQVKRVRFERAVQARTPGSEGETSAVLERRPDGWHMIEPVPARAESFQIERLLAVLDERSLARYPAKDLERYGLDHPIARLTLND